MNVYLQIPTSAKKARSGPWFFVCFWLTSAFASLAFAQTSATLSTINSNTISSSERPLAVKNKNSAQISLKGYSTRNDTSVNRGFNFDLSADLNYDLAPELSLRIRPGALLSSSQQVSRDEESRQANSWYLLEASAAFHVMNGVDLYLGALNQKDYFSKISMANISFPAVGIQVTPYNSENHQLKFFAENAVPTYSGVATQVGDLEEPPSLDSYGAKLNSRWNSHISTELHVNQFEFRNLPTTLATAGLKLGNSVQKYNTNTYAYLYEYKGIETSAQTNINIYRNSGLELSASQVVNRLAPNDSNTGLYTKIAPYLFISNRLTVKPFIETYRIESDAVVASYSDQAIGRANRIGSTKGMAFDAKNYSLSITMSEDKTLKETPFQSNEKLYFIKLETKNVAL